MTTPIRKVHKIESRIALNIAAPVAEQHKKRVAAYARVSTDSDEQLSSYEAQINFYAQHIKSNPEWEFVSVYTDEGISGTNTKKREGFNHMIEDALCGKIDLILTKSISRFARNTVDILTAVRRLKEKGVEVYFEKENIHTLDAKGEVMITIMSSLAQEESRSISENITWGKRKSMEDGKVNMPYKSFLGYEKGEDGLPKIVEAEAEIVRKIYNLFLEGKTVRAIANLLVSEGIPTPAGKKQWSVSTIMSILQNEKYKGDALLQKTYTADFLTKKIRKNRGELPQYYIKNSHPAIINPEMFDLVQKEIERRRPVRRQLHKNSPFTARILCNDCHKFYGRKVWHSGSKYRKCIWRCNHKYDHKTACTTPILEEEEIMDAFVMAFNQVLEKKEPYIKHLKELFIKLADTQDLEKQQDLARTKHADLINDLRRYMNENTRQIQDQEEYNRRFSEMDARCKRAEERIAYLDGKMVEQLGQKEQIHRCLKKLEQCRKNLTEFDADLWCTMVDSVTVFSDKSLMFRFYGNMKVSVKISENK